MAWEVSSLQRPHHIARALGSLGCLVIFKTIADGVAGFRQVGVNVWLTSNSDVDTLPEATSIFYSTSLLVTANDILEAHKHRRVIYDYIDHIDFAISGKTAPLMLLKQAAFDGAADMIVSSASALHKESLTQCGEERCFLIPNGVDIQHYRNAQHLQVNLPQRLTAFREKYSRIVGYFGAIAPWLCYKTIAEVTNAMPDVGFLFIGSDYGGYTSKLPRNSNFLYLGAVDYDVLPAYARLFDVCFIPFASGEIAHSTSPLKLYEYFALEKPVVVTANMDECIAFQEVFSGKNVTELVETLNRAFSLCDDDSYRARLRALAEENDWSHRAEAFLSALGRFK